MEFMSLISFSNTVELTLMWNPLTIDISSRSMEKIGVRTPSKSGVMLTQMAGFWLSNLETKQSVIYLNTVTGSTEI